MKMSRLAAVGVAAAAAIAGARSAVARTDDGQGGAATPPLALPSESQPPTPGANELPAGTAGLNPIRHGQVGAAPQQTTAVSARYREPRFWLYNDNYFAWQPNSPGRTTVKFQISVLYDLVFIDPWRYFSVNFAYTQKSFWDLFAVDRSSPFIENNYRPEVFLTFRPNPKERVTEASFGIQHESNGLGKDAMFDQSPNSRGWNNVFLKLRYGFDRKIPTSGVELYLTLGLRGWLPFTVAPSNLMDYIGPGIATVNLDIRLPNHPRLGEVALEGIAHERSIEGSVYFPIEALTVGHARFSIYAQYFYGYAERLITFDQKVTNYYIGLGFI